MVLFQGKGDFYIAEAAFDGFAFGEIGGTELAAPDYVVGAVIGDVDVETICLGCRF